MLSHITQTQAGRNKWEGFQTDSFRITFLFSDSIADQPLLTEHVTTVTGWKVPEIEIVEQDQGAQRLFASNKITTRQDLAISLTLNFDDEADLYVYTSLLAVKQLTNNHDTFEKGLKKDYTFDIVVEYFLRNGQKVYERKLNNCILNGGFADGVFDADIADSEMKLMEINVSGEWYNEDAK